MPEKQMEQEEGRKKKKGKGMGSVPEPDEETDEYLDWPSQPLSLNEASSVFDKGTFHGLNTDKNVFNKTAVFHTERNK